MSGFYIHNKNSKGENEIVVPISLPVQAMERFENQLDILLTEGPTSHLQEFCSAQAFEPNLLRVNILICACALSLNFISISFF